MPHATAYRLTDGTDIRGELPTLDYSDLEELTRWADASDYAVVYLTTADGYGNEWIKRTRAMHEGWIVCPALILCTVCARTAPETWSVDVIRNVPRLNKRGDTIHAAESEMHDICRLCLDAARASGAVVLSSCMAGELDLSKLPE